MHIRANTYWDMHSIANANNRISIKMQYQNSPPMLIYINKLNLGKFWSTTNKMIPNVGKTKDMVISFHKQPIDISPICIEGIEIERVKSVSMHNRYR